MNSAWVKAVPRLIKYMTNTKYGRDPISTSFVTFIMSGLSRNRNSSPATRIKAMAATLFAAAKEFFYVVL